MSVKRLYLAGLMLIIGYQQVSMKQAEAGQVPENTDKPVVTKTIAAPVEIMPEEQLELNKHLLLTDQNINVRTKTASLLLMSPDPNARKILIDALSLTDNSAARMAICRALIQSRSSKDPVVNKEDFIQPLLGIFDTGSDAEVQLASDAILIFKYETIEKALENIVTDPTKPAKTRINVIGALKNLPEINAIIRLIRLVDDPDKQVAAEAEKALRSLGIPVGANSTERENIIADLLNNGIDAFLQDLLIIKETQIQQITTDLASWQKLYLTLLDKTYRSKSDDAERSKFLDENLKSPKADVKIWALDQVYQWIQGTNPNLPKLLEPVLISLISDPEKKVRLKTAVILASMRTLDSSAPLLAQFQVEPDEQVARQLLDTLGWVVSYGLSSSSPFKISPEIRQQVLDLAADYLSKGQTSKAQVGAQVLRRLLERDSLQPEEVDKKLRLFIERYNQPKGDQNETLRGDLLKAMVGLVAKDSVCKAQAGKLFEPFFSEALDSKTDSLRETAVDGLANIDETRALITLRKKGFAKDPSSNIRIKMIALAKNVGGIEDLDWLVDKIGSNGESQLAWQAMLRIFSSSGSDILNQWMDRLTSDQSKLSVDQKIDFLKLAEAKITGEDQTKAREKLAKLYYDAGLFEDAANSYRRLQENATNPEEKKNYSSQLLDAYLNWQNPEYAALLIKNYLSEGDLEPNDVLIQSIDNYLNNQSDEGNIDALLKALDNIEIASPIPKWNQQMKIWIERFRKTSEPNNE
jgi:HEAT repeat protein